MAWLGTFLALLNVAAVVAERTVFAVNMMWRRRIEEHYEPIARHALNGDAEAQRELATSPVRYRIAIARLLISPLYDHRDPQRIARTRAIFEAMSLVAGADRLLHSRWWWRRALAVRALGVLQLATHTPAIVAALDDRSVEVRAAALDAIADLRDPESLMAVVVRLSDESLHRGRRFAAIAALGSECEAFLLEMAGVDASNR